MQVEKRRGVTGGEGFAYRGGSLSCGGVALADIVDRFGTPTYVYDADTVLARFTSFQSAFAAVPSLICFAVKTNSNVALLALLARAGAGFDIVSGGELARLQRAGAPPERIVFAGVGKTRDEMDAALAAGILAFNIESLPEAAALSEVARARGSRAPVALRVNPGVSAGGHRYISTGTASDKFGIPIDQAPQAAAAIAELPGLALRGLHCHVGSQILDVATFARVAEELTRLAAALQSAGHSVAELNLGGGLGIRYRDEAPPTPADLAAVVLPIVRGTGLRLLFEPGRAIVGPAGVLLARVLYRKETSTKTFVVVDAGMNDLVRPSLYGAHHEILPLTERDTQALESVDVVGPICESGDFLARDRALPRLVAGDAIAVCNSGAYGFVMSSNYNSRPRAAEVLVHDGTARLVRRRETIADLLRAEIEIDATAERAE